MKSHRTLIYAGLFLACALVSGCKKDEVAVYSIPKPGPEPTLTENSGTGGMPPVSVESGSAAGQPSLTMGTPPADWETQPLTSMRQASFLVKGANGVTADISLVTLAGPAGGMMENINRWLSQLGKPEITGDQLAQIAQHTASPLGDVTLVDFEGLPQGADAAKDGRIIGGIATAGGQTYFFKMRGNSALVESQKAAFVRWIRTVSTSRTVGTNPGGGEAAMPTGPATTETPTPATENPQIKWDAPKDWKTVAPTSMRYASFTIAGPGGESADVSVSVFDGDGGGNLENINRWRTQAGMEPVKADGLKSIIVPVISKDGEAILTADLIGAKSGILAGWARTGGRAWFFKLTGPSKIVAAEKPAFAKFLQSVEFHP